MTSTDKSVCYGQYESSDDLEKALVLAAADADARNNESISSNSSVDSNHTTETCQNSVPKSSSNKRKLESDDDEHMPTKYAVTEEGKVEGYANLVAKHYNTLEEKGLDERSKSRIVYMRNFHNWIKSMLINEYLGEVKDKKKHNEPVRVLDMCCGKGGDLLKWKKANITHLICSDIASVSLEQCKSRYEDMKTRNRRERHPGNIYSIEYIAADCSKARLREKYKDPSVKLDLVSCQFAVHYSFESVQQTECLIRNASECLQPGGFFIGTIPDANDLIARVRKSGAKSFGNDVYKVNFDCDTNKPPFFGAKYNFHLDGVVDCPEFLVHFPTFVKLSKKYGLKLVKKEKFYEYYERMKGEGRNLLYNMRSLESYPPTQGATLVGNADDDYEHAENFLKKEGNSSVKLGTLSKSEWEASCNYIHFLNCMWDTKFLKKWLKYTFIQDVALNLVSVTKFFWFVHSVLFSLCTSYRNLF